jgi:hypothetical protein
MAQPGGHEHIIDVPVVLGPLVLRVGLLAAVCAVTGYALLRAFLGRPNRATAATVTISAAVATFLSLMLAKGFDLPDQVAVLILAGIAVPLILAMSRTPSPATRYAERFAPLVLAVAAAAALVEFGRAVLTGGNTVLLHTGLMLALVGLSWYTLGLPRWRPGTVALHVTAAVLATAALAGAGYATVLLTGT